MARADRPSSDAAATPSGSCRHCGRAVAETLHARASYTVGGFVLHTGPTETAVVRRPDSDEVAFVYQRLLHPVTLVTCARCYADPTRRALHLTWTYSVD
jgi:hypothetical protein